MNTIENSKTLYVPLDAGLDHASIPYPMTEESFQLLLATLHLWHKRLVPGWDPFVPPNFMQGLQGSGLPGTNP